MKSVSNLPEWGNVCKTVSKSQAARVTLLNKARDTRPKPQLWKQGAGHHFAAWTPLWMISWFHSLPSPLCHFRAGRAMRFISSGPRAVLTVPYRVPRGGWTNPEHILYRVILMELLVPGTKKAESSSWEERITLNLKKKKSLQRWTRGKICSWKFPWISKYLFKPFLITNLPNWSMIHLLIIFFPWSYTDDNVETVKFFINCLFCVLLSPRSQEIKIK